MNEIDSNKDAWGKLAEDHYHAFLRRYREGGHDLNAYIKREIGGELAGKSLIHLQCNTGADSIRLAQLGACVTGVDLVPENIFYAKKLATELGRPEIRFLEADMMKLHELHSEKYDIVFTSEGVLGWLPDLEVWGRTIRGLLKDGGFFYIFDSHPFFLAMDEQKLAEGVFDVKYPYFGKVPDEDDQIGGYASEMKEGVRAYFWMHTVSDIINALTKAGLHVEFFNEFSENYFNAGGMEDAGPGREGLCGYPFNPDRFPLSYSLKATVYRP